jgi:hypothetical protein
MNAKSAKISTPAPVMKKTQTYGGMNYMKTTELVLGNCHGDDNPDAWFPDVPQGGFSVKKQATIGAEMRRAIVLCNSCPRKQACLQEGMKDENLGYGIWGGMLAGERVLLSGKTFTKLSDQGRALISYRALKPLIGR